MSTLQSNRKPIALLVSDFHFTELVPRARNEIEWYITMERVINKLWEWSKDGDIPIIAAGDIFDRWSVSSRLVNYLISKLPPMFAVAGQHDMPYHSIDRMEESAFSTLLLANAIEMLDAKLDSKADVSTIVSGKKVTGLHVWGYSFGQFPDGMKLSIRPSTTKLASDLRIGVFHRYCWNDNNGHEKAVNSDHVKSIRKEYGSLFDVMVFGDNHKGFIDESDKTLIINCGTQFCRTKDEEDYNPFAVMLYDDKSCDKMFYNTQFDAWKPIYKNDKIEVDDFILSLQGLSKENMVTFRDLVIKEINTNKDYKRLKKQILEIIDNV